MTPDAGPVDIVTGAARGMGRACAELLATRPGPLVVVDLDADELGVVAEALGATAVTCDVSAADDVAALAARCAALGPLGALVHAAGISPTMASAERIFDVDLRGTALLLDAFRPLCATGSVAVCFASMAAEMVAPVGDPDVDAVIDDPLADDLFDRLTALDRPELLESSFAYGWAKRGVIRLCRREAIRWGPLGGRVCSVSPGIITTAMGQAELDQQPFMQVVIDRTPLGRVGDAAEVATVVEFLTSPGASFVTGTDIRIDGGAVPGVMG